MMRGRLTALLTALALSTGFAACSAGAGDDDSKGGGTFTTIIETTEETAPVNPYAAPTNAWGQYNSMSLAWAKSHKTDPNAHFPGLAAEWEVAEDQSEITIHLQPDAKWSDGEDVTADDVVLSSQIAYTQGSGAFVLTPGAAGTVSDVEVVDDKTVTFTQDSEAPTNTFVRGVLGIIVVPEHVWGDLVPDDFDDLVATAQGDDDAAEKALEKITATGDEIIEFAPETDVSAGPFVFERATPSEVLLTKNEHFFNADQVAPDNVVIKNYSGNEQIWGYLRGGEVDNAPFTAVPPDTMKQFESDPKIEVSRSFSPVVAGLAFNQSKKPYDDVHVRKALAYAVDREQMIEVATPEGGTNPITTSGMHGESAKEFLGDRINDFDPYAHDPAKAEAELKEAGFTKEGDKWMQPNGEPWKVTMQVVSGFSDWIAAGENMVTQLQEFGVEAETVTSADFTIYQEEMAAGEYDMGFWLLGITPSPYDVYQRIYGQTNGWTVLGNKLSYSEPGENGNWMGGSETYEVDGKQVNPGELTMSLRTATPEEQPDTIYELAKITNENLPVIQMWDYVNTQFFVNERFEGFPTDEEALRLNAGFWMQQGWITTK